MKDLGPVPLASELGRICEPIEAEMASLNKFLLDEFHSRQPFVHELLVHIAKYRGKQIRPACVLLAGKYFGGVGPDHVKTAAIVELIHTATLVHDDVLDDSMIRRRVETVNQHWGERAAILLGDFIYSRGFSLSTEVDGVSGLLANTTHVICEGELLQIGTAFVADLSEDRYYEIIRKKTACLYGMACRVGAMLSGAPTDALDAFDSFGDKLGMAFQIADDTLDLTGDEEIVGKSLGTDLKKGKMTLPLIRLRDELEGGEREELLWLLRHPDEVGTQQRVIRLLLDKDIMAGVRNTAAGFVDAAVVELDRLPASPLRENFEILARFVQERHL